MRMLGISTRLQIRNRRRRCDKGVWKIFCTILGIEREREREIDGITGVVRTSISDRRAIGFSRTDRESERKRAFDQRVQDFLELKRKSFPPDQ